MTEEPEIDQMTFEEFEAYSASLYGPSLRKQLEMLQKRLVEAEKSSRAWQNDNHELQRRLNEALEELKTRRDNFEIMLQRLLISEKEVKRIKRMLDWALKQETQERLQADFDRFDELAEDEANDAR